MVRLFLGLTYMWTLPLQVGEVLSLQHLRAYRGHRWREELILKELPSTKASVQQRVKVLALELDDGGVLVVCHDSWLKRPGNSQPLGRRDSFRGELPYFFVSLGVPRRTF